jgi:ATP-dependent RNA helicase SUPV3L1/SUV3
VYELEQGLGTAVVRDAGDRMGELDPRDLDQLRALDVVIGERVIYVESLLKREIVERRLALCRVYFEPPARFTGPHPGAVSLVPATGVDPRAYTAIGYPVFGTRAIRADAIERLHRALAGAQNERPAPGKLASWIGCSVREIPRIAVALGPAAS